MRLIGRTHLAAAGLALAWLSGPHGRPPTPHIEAGPARPTAEVGARFAFSDGMRAARFRCRLDAGRVRRCSSPARYAALAGGRHDFAVRAVLRGRRSAPAHYRWTIDVTRPPAPALGERPDELTADSMARLRFADAEPGVGLRCALDGGAAQPCDSPAEYGPLVDGVHHFAVSARDAAGNAGVPATYRWTVDATAPPAPSIVGAPRATTDAPDAHFTFSDAEPAVRFRCRLDGAPSPCDSPADYAPLAEGEHAFGVTAVDAAGNASAQAGRSWTIDATAPPPPLISTHPDDPTTRGEAAFGLSEAESAATLLCRLDDGPALPCESPQRYPGPLAAGAHTFAAQARDAAGNRSAPVTFGWAVTPDLYRASVLATPGLVGYWRLGELGWAPALDQRGRQPGVYSGGVALGAAGALVDDTDTAAAFDGISGELLLPGASLAANGTLEGWFDWRAGVAVLRDNTDAAGWILAYDSGGRLAARAGGTTLTTTVPTASVRDGWHHYALTKAGGTSALYLDGRLVRTAAGAASARSLSPWHVMNNGIVDQQYARGRADELAVYDTALTAAQIAEHHRLGSGS